MIVTRPPGSERETLSLQEAEILVGMGVDLKSANNRHYTLRSISFPFQEGDYTAFVGSANFTIGGFERNDESVAFFRDPRLQKIIDKEVDRLTNTNLFRLIIGELYQLQRLKRINTMRISQLSDYGFVSDPSPLVPGAKVTNWAGMSEIKQLLLDVVESVLTTDVGLSEFLHLHGNYKVPANHTLLDISLL